MDKDIAAQAAETGSSIPVKFVSSLEDALLQGSNRDRLLVVGLEAVPIRKSSKMSGKGKLPGKGGGRFYKNIGLGFKMPKEAITGNYIDKKRPFTGNLSMRGRILAGTCYSAKMIRTIIVRRDYWHYVKKYQRYEKRHCNIPAHISPAFRVKEGDRVIIGPCRSLSKTVRFNVLRVIPARSSTGGAKKAFTAM